LAKNTDKLEDIKTKKGEEENETKYHKFHAQTLRSVDNKGKVDTKNLSCFQCVISFIVP
jgi:hypothetical protein